MISTLRLIMVSNGKKLAGSLLQFICSVVFIISASLVIIDFNADIFKILAFAFGCSIGSYIGCILEEKIAIGSNMIICITENNSLSNKLRNNGYVVTVTRGSGIKNDKYILFIMVARKGKYDLVNIINKIDEDAYIISENANTIKKEL